MKPKKKGRGAVASASAAATARGTPVDGMDLENEQPAQAVPEVNDEVVRKEQYIACKLHLVAMIEGHTTHCWPPRFSPC